MAHAKRPHARSKFSSAVRPAEPADPISFVTVVLESPSSMAVRRTVHPQWWPSLKRTLPLRWDFNELERFLELFEGVHMFNGG